jgi:hypothetical protein
MRASGDVLQIQPSLAKKPPLAKKWHSMRAKAMAKSISLNFDGRASGPRIEMVSPSHWLQAAAASAWTRRSGWSGAGGRR